MRRILRHRPSPAMVVAFIALAVALGGTSYAALKLPANSVGTKQLKKKAVTRAKIAPNAVTSGKVKDGSLRALDFAASQLPKGDKGDPGATGAKGDTGPSGFAADCNEGLATGDVMVRVGSVCIDRYEASIWTARTGGTQITGAIPCNVNGQDCTNIYARSVAGVAPRASITWFQAQQALANSGKRLPSNAEWQMAVAGTPDGAPCNVRSGSVQSAGANAGCISNHATNDMVGNLSEWVADWDEQASAGQFEPACSNWPAGFGSDLTCVGRGAEEASSSFPGAPLRGGGFGSGTDAGPFAVFVRARPFDQDIDIGFRGAR
jgi:formylglycine-generating enzyme required for sulfatase activity